MEEQQKLDAKSYLKHYLNEVIFSQAFSEGVSATFPQTEQLLNGFEDINVAPLDRDVIISLKKAWQFIYEKLDSELFFEDICLLNALVSDSTNPQPGRLRTVDVYILDKDLNKWYPKLPNEREIREKIFKLNQIKNPIEKALEFFAYFTKAQAFNNCNKRTSFLLANKILIENNIGIIYPLPNKTSDNKYKDDLVEYYKDSSNKENLFISLLENNLCHYQYDSIRKNQNQNRIDIFTLNTKLNLDFLKKIKEKEITKEM